MIDRCDVVHAHVFDKNLILTLVNNTNETFLAN